MRSSATFHREWGYLSGGRNLFRTLRIASIAAAAGALGGAGLVLAVGQAPEANPSVAARTLVTPEINPAAKPSDATVEAPQPPENGSAAFHVYSSELNGLVTRKMIKSLSRAPLKQPLCPASSAHHRLMRSWLAPLSLSFVTSSLEEIKRSPTGALGPACVCSERLNSLRPRRSGTSTQPAAQYNRTTWRYCEATTGRR